MKTKKIWYWIITVVIVIGSMVFVSKYETNEQRDARITAEVLSLPDDSILVKYLQGIETPGIKDKVIIIYEFTLDQTPEQLSIMHINALEKALSTETTAKKLIESRDKYLLQYIPMMGDSLKMNLSEIAISHDDVNSAFWLLNLKPDLLLERLKGDYYTEKEVILADLGNYYEPEMGSGIMEKLARILPDSAITENLGYFDAYLMQTNPKRLQKIYKQMDCFTFSSYYETDECQGRLKSVDWGKQFFLKHYLPKSTAEDLALLFHIGAINNKTLATNMKGKQLLKSEPIWE